MSRPTRRDHAAQSRGRAEHPAARHDPAQQIAARASLPPVTPIATETPAAIFTLGSYREVKERLVGLTWGAEDLPAAIGATTGRTEDGRCWFPEGMD